MMPGPDFGMNEQINSELVQKIRVTFGLPRDYSLQRGLILLGIETWQTVHLLRAVLAVIVKEWVLESWYPNYLSPNGCVQQVLTAGYKIAEQRGNSKSFSLVLPGDGAHSSLKVNQSFGMPKRGSGTT